MRWLRALFAVMAMGVAALLILYFAFPDTLVSLLLAGARSRAGLHRAEVEIPGFHIVYLDGGRGEPLLLLHGLGAEKDAWTETARYLTGSHRVVAPDLPGFGESSKPDDADYSVEAQVPRVAAFVQALGLTRFSIAGNSMGGWIAGAYAAAHPDQVVTAWLLDPGGVAGARDSEMMHIVDAGALPPMFPRNATELHETLRFIAVREPPIPGFLIPVIARRQSVGRDRNVKVFRTLMAEVSRAPLEKAMAGSKVPTLIVWGDRDRLCDPAGAEVLHKVLPSSQVKMMRQIGHVPMLEDAAGSARDYLEFRQHLPRVAGR